MKTKLVTIGRFEGRGKTITEAREALERNIVSATDGDWTPAAISAFGQLVVVYRDCDAWITQRYENGQPNRGHGVSFGDRETVIDSAVMSVAQNAWGEGHSLETIETTLAHLWHSRLSSDLRSWCAFQLAHRAAPADCADRHSWACDHQREYLAQVA